MNEEQNFQLGMAQLQHRYNMEYQMVQATAAFEHAALKPLFLLNGGAAAGFTALFGALMPEETKAPLLIAALFWWTLGLLFAFGASTLGAMSQFNFRRYRGIQVSAAERAMGITVDRKDWSDAETWSRNGRHYRAKAVSVGFLSLACFVLALIPAAQTFL
jgi:hypothetical protein